MVLVVSSAVDDHVQFLLDRISADRREQLVRLNTEEFPSLVRISLTDDPVIILPERTVRLRDCTSVWYRRPGEPQVAPEVRDECARRYAEEESRNLLNALWEGMEWPLWVSKPANIRRAHHKWSQLAVAQRLGFRCPRTISTNDPSEARAFCADVRDAVVKPIFRGHFQAPGGWKMIYTNPIEHDDPRIVDVELAPATFQEYIPKKLELRVTVVGDQVFACAIDSQANEKTRHDWRHYDLPNTPHHTFVLPDRVRNACVQLVRHYGLMFSAIDLILTPQDEYVFLEINPNGQWAWIEQASGLPIAAALEELLFSRG